MVLVISPHHMHLHVLAMLQRIRRQADFPHAIRIALHRVRLAVPEIEITNQEQGTRSRGPLSVHPFPSLRIAVKTQPGVGKGKLHERAMPAADALQLRIIQSHTPFDFAFKGSQPAICQH